MFNLPPVQRKVGEPKSSCLKLNDSLNRKMTQMTKMFRSIFQPKKPVKYKLPNLQLFAPDRPKDQSKEDCPENIKILKQPLAALVLKATVGPRAISDQV